MKEKESELGSNSGVLLGFFLLLLSVYLMCNGALNRPDVRGAGWADAWVP